MKYTLLPIIFFVLSVNAAHSQRADNKLLSEHLTVLFGGGKADTTDLSKDFSVAVYTRPGAIGYLQSMARHYACDSVIVSQTGTDNTLEADFYPKGKAPEKTTIHLDADGKIAYIDLLDKMGGMNRYQASRLLAEVPFETDEHGAVYLTIRLNKNKRPLRFLFDTGASGMAIPESLADSLGLKVSREQNTSVVGGNMHISISENNTVHLDTFAIPGQSIALFKEMHGGIDGIIGNTIAKLFITRVDYDRKRLSLYSFGTHHYATAGEAVPVTLPDGVFIIPGTVRVTKDKPYNGQFVFDLGAAYSLICFRPFVKHNRLLVDGFVPEYNGTTSSLGMVTPTFSGRAVSFSFAQMPAMKDMPVTLMSGGGQSESWNPGFDGSIGTRIISRYNFTINMQQKEIHFSPNKSYAYPYDFVIGAYLFGFDTEGQLRVQSQVSGFGQKGVLNTGTAIKSINGVAAVSLRDDAKAISALLALPEGSPCKVEYSEGSKTEVMELTKE